MRFIDQVFLRKTFVCGFWWLFLFSLNALLISMEYGYEIAVYLTALSRRDVNMVKTNKNRYNNNNNGGYLYNARSVFPSFHKNWFKVSKFKTECPKTDLLVISYICWDTPSEDSGLWQLPKVYSFFKEIYPLLWSQKYTISNELGKCAGTIVKRAKNIVKLSPHASDYLPQIVLSLNEVWFRSLTNYTDALISLGSFLTQNIIQHHGNSTPKLLASDYGGTPDRL